MTLDEPKKDEVPFQVDGIDVLIENNVRSYAEDNTVDYVTGPRGTGFAILRPGRSAC